MVSQSVPPYATESCLGLIADPLRHTVKAGMFAQTVVLALEDHLLELLNFGCLNNRLPSFEMRRRRMNYLTFADDKFMLCWLNLFVIIAVT